MAFSEAVFLRHHLGGLPFVPEMKHGQTIRET